MITRSKLVEQLFKDYQIRSQRKCPALTIFSPKPFLTSWLDVIIAILFACLFGVLLVFSYVALYFGYFFLALVIVCFGFLLHVRLKSQRQAFKLRKERLLPLSM